MAGFGEHSMRSRSVLLAAPRDPRTAGDIKRHEAEQIIEEDTPSQDEIGPRLEDFHEADIPHDSAQL